MEITNVNVRKICSNDKMKAVCSVTFDDMLVVHDIKVIEGKEKLFAAMPSRKSADGTYRDIVHPITSDMREELQNAILKKYEEFLASEPAEAEA